jgi:hypothetical protein
VGQSGDASDKLKKLGLINVSSSNISSSHSPSYHHPSMPASLDFEEVLVTIRKSEKGFGFELRNGILVVKVLPNTPAFHAGIKVGDIILKVNGTCVRTKDPNEINTMIYESNSFVSLALQRKVVAPKPIILSNDDTTTNDTITLKNLTNIPKLDNDIIIDSNSNSNSNSISNYENSENINSSSSAVFEALIEKSASNHQVMNSNSDLVQDNHHHYHHLDQDDADDSDDSLSHKRTNKHNKHSISDESFHQKNSNRNASSSLSTNVDLKLAFRPKAIKKTKSNVNPKTSKSMSNITASTLTHSISDNDLDHVAAAASTIQAHGLDYDQDFIECKDELSYTSEDNLNDNFTNDRNSVQQQQQQQQQQSVDMSGFTDYARLITRPINLSVLLNYILSSEKESPKNLYFCIFVDDLLNSNEKKEIIFKWAYEIYSTFLMPHAPLKLKINENYSKRIEDIFDRNSADNINHLKKLLEEAKHESIDEVNLQLSKLREVKQLGLANLFHSTELLRLSQSFKPESVLSDQMKTAITDGFQSYITEITADISRISQDWNDPRSIEAQKSALISSFVTFVKRFNLPVKSIGKFDLDKIPTYLSKKIKTKKLPNSAHSARNHHFVDNLTLSSKLTCSKCAQAFWGIGFQGLICQKPKCEVKIHRACYLTGVTLDCHGSQKTIKTDYKEKLDNIQKILFGSGSSKVKKEEDHVVAMDTGGGGGVLANSRYFGQNSFDSQRTVIHSELDRQSSTASGSDCLNAGGDFESTNQSNQRNLPVNLAIQRFENLTKKGVTVPVTSNGTSLARSSTMNSGNTSPNSINRSNSNSMIENEYYNRNKQNHQILPNKLYTQNNNPNTNTTSSSSGKTSKDQAACKRVGSLKVDAKKIKSNVTRSKSDPEPVEITNAKLAISQTDRYSIDSTTSTLIDDSFSPNSTQTSNQFINFSSRIQPSPTSTTTITPTPSYLHSSSSSSTLTSQQAAAAPPPQPPAAATRHSWMNDSDMEVDEELPNLSVNIEKSGQEMLSKKEMKIQEVINELIHTEQKHVRNLKIMNHHFYIPIKVEYYLTDEERNLLFPNLERVLDLHSAFNNKLKELRKENVIVPIKDLISIILEQFQGEQGEQFQEACATFCQNQGEAMKLLQTKMKNQTDRFQSFLNRAENDHVCRKLHLKDFIPTEVQRLVKYRLLFHELTKNASDDADKQKLLECMNASSKISLYVNKAVTECENRKRTNEIQARMDTKEFDQYCTKSPLLAEYKHLDIKSRKLIYEGELEWKMNGMVKLMALLFEDILIFLERERSNGDEKRRYILRPLFYTLNKTKQMFTPVIPLNCINSFSAMHEKRNFHLVVIIDDNIKSKSNKPEKVIQTQMLFIFIAKSGDERNKWISYLQELTGKMSQTEKQNASIDLTLPHQPLSSTSSLLSLPKSEAQVSGASNTLGGAKSIHGSVSTSALLSTKKMAPTAPAMLNNTDSGLESIKTISEESNSIGDSNNFVQKVPLDKPVDHHHHNNSKVTQVYKTPTTLNPFELLHSQLFENSKNLTDLMQTRRQILAKLTRIYDLEEVRNCQQTRREHEDVLSPVLPQNAPNESLLNHSINLLNYISQTLTNNTTATTNSSTETNEKMSRNKLDDLNAEQNLYENMLRLEHCLNTMRIKNMYNNPANSMNTDADCNNRLPNLQLSAKINRKLTRNMQLIESFTNSELVSSSVLSTSNTGDLSEDEQINYYEEENDEEDEGLVAASEQEHYDEQEEDEDEDDNSDSDEHVDEIEHEQLEDLVACKTRCLSNSSDGTLIVMPNNATITKTVNFLDKSRNDPPKFDNLDPDADDEDEANQHHMVINFKFRDSAHLTNETANTDADSDEYESEVNSNHVIQLAAADPFRGIDQAPLQQPKSPAKFNPLDSTTSITSSNGKYSYHHHESLLQQQHQQQSYFLKNNQFLDSNLSNQNDLSDDEVKDYHVFKENSEDDSQA